MVIRGIELGYVQAGFEEARELTLAACLGEGVGQHVTSLAEVYEDIVVIDQVAHEVLPATEVFGFLRYTDVFRDVGESTVVDHVRDWGGGKTFQLTDEVPRVDGSLSCGASGANFSLSTREHHLELF